MSQPDPPLEVTFAEAQVSAVTPAEPLIQADATAAAFFDLDNTVIQGASVFHVAKGLYRRDFFPTRLILKGLWLQAYFRLAGREKAEHIEDARSSILGFIKGHTVTELQEIGSEIYEESIASRIWPGTRAIAQMHLDVGQQVWLVTAAPVEVAGIIAARLGLTGALGTTAEHEEGIYTGRLTGELLHGPAKAEAVRALTQEHGLDLARCFAYSDSFNDLPMLSLVGQAPARSIPIAGCWSTLRTTTGRSGTTAPVARRFASGCWEPVRPAQPRARSRPGWRSVAISSADHLRLR